MGLANIEVQLVQRQNRIATASLVGFADAVQRLVELLRNSPELQSVAGMREPSADIDEWFARFSDPASFRWPATPSERTAMWMAILRRWGAGERVENLGDYLSYEEHPEGVLRDVVERVVHPLVDYLLTAIGQQSTILYLLQRYRRQVEWFDAKSLHAAWMKRRHESVYQEHLYRFLFEQGLNSFREPKYTVGEPDLIANTETSDPFVCELKVYSGKVSQLARGINQLRKYMGQHRFGYLVVVNMTSQVLRFPNDHHVKEWPPRIHIGDCVANIVTVDALPGATASRLGKARETVISKDKLLTPVIDQDAR